jgi:hypothetical protein
MFGPEHQIARKTPMLRAFSRLYGDFISDLKFGSAVPNMRSGEARALIGSSLPQCRAWRVPHSATPKARTAPGVKRDHPKN